MRDIKSERDRQTETETERMRERINKALLKKKLEFGSNES